MPACRRYALASWWSSYWRRSRALLLTGTRLLIQAGSVSVRILEERMCAAGCELALAPSGMANRCGACRSADWTGKREQRGQIPNSQASPQHRAKVMAPTVRAGRHRHVHSTSRSGQRSSFQIFPSSNWHRRPAREILRLGPSAGPGRCSSPDSVTSPVLALSRQRRRLSSGKRKKCHALSASPKISRASAALSLFFEAC